MLDEGFVLLRWTNNILLEQIKIVLVNNNCIENIPNPPPPHLLF